RLRQQPGVPVRQARAPRRDVERGGGRRTVLVLHSVFVHRREGRDAELYVADRSNRRIQVFDLDGAFLRSFGNGFLDTPSGFARWGDRLVVAELSGRLAVLDEADELVGYVGADPERGKGRASRPGWPNALTDDGRATAPRLPEPGHFNSPHSVAV